MKILNFGSCNIDQVYSLDHIVRIGETETTHKMSIFPGGKGLNQSIAIARAGAKVYHAGCVGNDGQMLIDVLNDAGVDISYIRYVDEKNGHAVIQVSSEGHNSIFLYPGSNEMVTCEFIDEVLEDFGAGDVILLQNEISNVEYIVNAAYQKGMCITLNPSPFNDTIKRIDLNKISYMLLNEVEAFQATGCETPEEALVYFKTNHPRLRVMLTLGDRGCVYMDSEREIWQPAFKVDVVDTTAAGDTFTGFFVAELSRGTAHAEVLKKASAASAIAVSRNGAAPSIPTIDEVEEVLDGLTAKKHGGKNIMLMTEIEKYIRNNIRTASLEELSSILGYSLVYTGNLIKKVMGQSFSKLLQKKRCSIAADMLLHTDMSIHEIICFVGYENESFFRRIFKEKYGKNPLEFRNRGGNG